MKRAFLFGLGTFLILSALWSLLQFSALSAVLALILMPISVPVIRAAQRAPSNRSRLHAVVGWILGFLAVGICEFAVLGGAVFVSSLSSAQNVKVVPTTPVTYNIFPPVEYDHDYEGDLTIKMVDSIAELYAVCKINNPSLLACSSHNAKSCLIIMVKDEVMRKNGYSTGLLFRHERGHCNGWGADHAGQRPLLVGSPYWAPPDQRVSLPPEWEQEAMTIRAKNQQR
jgi:amino acid transporter